MSFEDRLRNLRNRDEEQASNFTDRLAAIRTGRTAEPSMADLLPRPENNGYVSVADLNRETNGSGIPVNEPQQAVEVTPNTGWRGLKQELSDFWEAIRPRNVVSGALEYQNEANKSVTDDYIDPIEAAAFGMYRPALSVGEAVSHGVDRAFGDEASHARMDAFGQKLDNTLKTAQETQPLAYGAGETIGNLALMGAVGEAVNAIPGMTALNPIVRAGVSGGAVRGMSEAIKGAGDVATGGMTGGEYVRRVGAGAIGGAAGGIASQAVANAGINLLLSFNKPGKFVGAQNMILPNILLGGASGAAFGATSTGVDELSKAIMYEDYKPNWNQIGTSAVTSGAFGAINFAINAAETAADNKRILSEINSKARTDYETVKLMLDAQNMTPEEYAEYINIVRSYQGTADGGVINEQAAREYEYAAKMLWAASRSPAELAQMAAQVGKLAEAEQQALMDLYIPGGNKEIKDIGMFLQSVINEMNAVSNGLSSGAAAAPGGAAPVTTNLAPLSGGVPANGAPAQQTPNAPALNPATSLAPAQAPAPQVPAAPQQSNLPQYQPIPQQVNVTREQFANAVAKNAPTAQNTKNEPLAQNQDTVYSNGGSTLTPEKAKAVDIAKAMMQRGERGSHIYSATGLVALANGDILDGFDGEKIGHYDGYGKKESGNVRIGQVGEAKDNGTGTGRLVGAEPLAVRTNGRPEWAGLDTGKRAELTNVVSRRIANAGGEAKTLRDLFSSDEEFAEFVYTKISEGNVVAEQMRPYINDIDDLIRETDKIVGTENTPKEVTVNAEQGQGDVRLRTGGVRNVAAGTGQQAGGMDRAAEADRARTPAVRGGKAAGGSLETQRSSKDPDAHKLILGRQVSAVDYNIPDADASQKVFKVTGGKTKYTDRAMANAKKNGRDVEFFAGGHLATKGNSRIEAWSQPSKNRMGLPTDDKYHTADQFYGHEEMELRIANGDVDVKSATQNVAAHVGEYDWNDIANEVYKTNYPEMDDDEITRQMLCDAAGNMNRLRGATTSAGKQWEALIDEVFSKAHEYLNDMTDGAFMLSDDPGGDEDLGNYPSSITPAEQTTLSNLGIGYDKDSDVFTAFSSASVPVTEEDINKAVAALTRASGKTEKETRKWVMDQVAIATLINKDRFNMDYERHGDNWLRKNSDYPSGSIELSNNCPKRKPLTDLSTLLLRNNPDRLFTAEDVTVMRDVLAKHGYQIDCGPCFNEDRRQLLGEIAQKFIDGVKGNEPLKQKIQDMIPANEKYVPTQYDLVTEEGLRKLRGSHPEIANAFVAFNNARGMQAGRLIESYSEYSGQFLNVSKKTVQRINENYGGYRMFSFSDAEIPLFMDLTQIVTDAAAVGAQIQGYSKQNSFLYMIKDTNMNFLRSHIAKGDGYKIEGGKKVLVFDPVEGIDFNDPLYKLIPADSKSIGNNVIGINDEQIRIGMKDPFLDQIIPFHTGIKRDILEKKHIGHWNNYKMFQREHGIKDNATGDQYDINFYTEVIKAAADEGKPIRNRRDFVEKFLAVAKAKGAKPRFWNFLDTNAAGDYIYTPGYEKFVVDFRMFDRNGNYIPQSPLEPKWDTEFITEMLKEYASGDHRSKIDSSVYNDVAKQLGISTVDTEFSSAPSELAESQLKNYKFNQEQTETGSTLRTLGKPGKNGSPIKRSSKYGVGKEIGGTVYFHRDYVDDVVPADVYESALQTLQENYPDFQFNCVEYNPKDNTVRFDEAPGFDTEREPVVGDYVRVKADGTTDKGHTDYIWHHKWLWVKDDYKGFDVKKSWEWSKQWLSTISGKTYEVNGKPYNDNAVSDGNGIGRWNAQLKAYGLPLDGDVARTAPVKQEHTSRGTSINTTKVPALYTAAGKKGAFKPGGVNIDIGAGVEGTPATAYLKNEYGVTSMPFDPFNRNLETNKAVTDFLQSGEKADTATCSNCLNVIDNADARSNVILEMAKSIKPDGTAFFTVYSNKENLEAGKAGEVKSKPDQWQEFREAKTYVPEIRKYFNDVPDPKGGLIIARDPKKNLPKAVWQIASTEYTDKEGNKPYAEDETVEFSTAPDENAEARLRDMDKKYLASVEDGDMETAQRMVDEEAKAAGYTRRAFHQTSAKNITVFDLSIGTNGGTDSETPYGVFTKRTNADIGLGDVQMSLYVRPGKTLRFKNREELHRYFGGEYKAILDEIDAINNRYDKLYEAATDEAADLQDKWLDAHPEIDTMSMPVEEFLKGDFYTGKEVRAAMDKADSIMSRWTESVNELSVKAKEVLTEMLKAEGYDSVEILVDSGSGGRKTDTFISLDNRAVKSADPVTYDDDGNVIPLSERFNQENPDIRYSTAPAISRLEEENERLRQRLAEARAETKLTRKWKADPRDVERVSKEIAASANSTISQTTLQNRMTKLVEDASNGKISDDEIEAEAGSIARDVVEKSEALASKDLTSYNAARNYLRSVYIAVPQSIRDRFDDFKFFSDTHKALTMKTDGVTIDTVYGNLQRTLGKEYFPDLAGDKQMLQQMGDVMDSLAPVYGNQYSFQLQAVIDVMSNDILNAALDIGQKVTYADRMDAKLRESKADTRAANEKLKTAESYIRSLQRIATRRAQQNEALKQHYADTRKRAMEARNLRQSQDKLLRVLKRLNNKKLPQATKTEILEAQKNIAGVIDTVTKSFTGELKAKRWTEQGITDIGQLEELIRKKTTPGLDPEVYDPNFVVDGATIRILDRYRQTSVKDLTAIQIQEMTEALLNIEARIAAEKKFVNSQLAMEFYQAGQQVIGDVGSAKPGKIQRKLRPLSAFLRMADYNDNSPLVVAYKEMLRGEEEADLYRREAVKPFSSLLADHQFLKDSYGKDAKMIDIPCLDMDGNDTTVQITPMMRIELYLDSLNDDNFRHIYYGGIFVPDTELYRKGDMTEAYNKAKRVRIERPTLQRLAEQMTPKEREFAKLLHTYYNEFAPERLNPVSLAMDGYEKFTTPDYYGITVDKNFLNTDYEAAMFEVSPSLARPGWGEERIESGKPIVLRDANERFLRAINENAMYAHMAIPLHNMNRLLNVQLTGNTDSVKAAISRQFPDGSADRYLKKFMADYAGKKRTTSSDVGKWLEKLRSNYSGAVLTLAISTAGVQFASYPVAAAVVSPSALLKALKPGKINLDFIDKRTAIFTKRTEGLSMMEFAELREQGKHIPKLLNWIQAVDVGTTSLLKRAAYYDVLEKQKNLKPGTEEFEKAVVDTYLRIIEETQPNYSASLRPDLLRSDDSFERQLILFATQPLQQYGILYDALGRYESAARHYKTNKTEETKKAKTEAAKGVGGVAAILTVASVLYATLKLATDTIMGNFKKKYGAEDGDSSVLAFLRQYGLNMLGGFTGMWPIGKTAVDVVMSIADTATSNLGGKPLFGGKKFYGVEVASIAAISDALESLVSAVNYLTRAAAGKSETQTAAKKVVALAEDVCTLLGIPAERAHQIVKAVLHHVGVEEDEIYDAIFD